MRCSDRSVATLALGLALLAAAACNGNREEVVAKLQALGPRLSQIWEASDKAHRSLPDRSAAVEKSCSEPVGAGSKVTWVTEEGLRSVFEPGTKRVAGSGRLSLAIRRSVFDRWREEPPILGAAINATRQIKDVEALSHLVVTRTEVLDRGSVEGKVIKRPARIRVWAFLVDFSGGRLLAAAATQAQNGRYIFRMKRRGSRMNEGDLINDAEFKAKKALSARLAASCGIPRTTRFW